MSITKLIETEAELWGHIKELEGPALPPTAIAVENWIEIEYNPFSQSIMQACVNAVNKQWFEKGYRTIAFQTQFDPQLAWPKYWLLRG